MAIAEISDLKRNLRIEHKDEDSLLESLIDRAQAHCEAFCKCTFSDEDEESIPQDVKQAVVLLASHWYEYRTNEDKQVWLSVDMAVKNLLWPHRNPELLF